MTAVVAIASLLLAGCTDLTDLDNRVKDLEGRMTKVEGPMRASRLCRSSSTHRAKTRLSRTTASWMTVQDTCL